MGNEFWIILSIVSFDLAILILTFLILRGIRALRNKEKHSYETAELNGEYYKLYPVGKKKAADSDKGILRLEMAGEEETTPDGQVQAPAQAPVPAAPEGAAYGAAYAYPMMPQYGYPMPAYAYPPMQNPARAEGKPSEGQPSDGQAPQLPPQFIYYYC